MYKNHSQEYSGIFNSTLKKQWARVIGLFIYFFIFSCGINSSVSGGKAYADNNGWQLKESSTSSAGVVTEKYYDSNTRSYAIASSDNPGQFIMQKPSGDWGLYDRKTYAPNSNPIAVYNQANGNWNTTDAGRALQKFDARQNLSPEVKQQALTAVQNHNWFAFKDAVAGKLKSQLIGNTYNELKALYPIVPHVVDNGLQRGTYHELEALYPTTPHPVDNGDKRIILTSGEIPNGAIIGAPRVYSRPSEWQLQGALTILPGTNISYDRLRIDGPGRIIARDVNWSGNELTIGQGLGGLMQNNTFRSGSFFSDLGSNIHYYNNNFSGVNFRELSGNAFMNAAFNNFTGATFDKISGNAFRNASFNNFSGATFQNISGNAFRNANNNIFQGAKLNAISGSAFRDAFENNFTRAEFKTISGDAFTNAHHNIFNSANFGAISGNAFRNASFNNFSAATFQKITDSAFADAHHNLFIKAEFGIISKDAFRNASFNNFSGATFQKIGDTAFMNAHHNSFDYAKFNSIPGSAFLKSYQKNSFVNAEYKPQAIDIKITPVKSPAFNEPDVKFYQIPSPAGEINPPKTEGENTINMPDYKPDYILAPVESVNPSNIGDTKETIVPPTFNKDTIIFDNSKTGDESVKFCVPQDLPQDYKSSGAGESGNPSNAGDAKLPPDIYYNKNTGVFNIPKDTIILDNSGVKSDGKLPETEGKNTISMPGKTYYIPGSGEPAKNSSKPEGENVTNTPQDYSIKSSEFKAYGIPARAVPSENPPKTEGENTINVPQDSTEKHKSKETQLTFSYFDFSLPPEKDLQKLKDELREDLIRHNLLYDPFSLENVSDAARLQYFSEALERFKNSKEERESADLAASIGLNSGGFGGSIVWVRSSDGGDGSGAVVGEIGNYYLVFTNKHVIQDDKSVTIGVSDLELSPGNSRPLGYDQYRTSLGNAEVVLSARNNGDWSHDVAILAIKKESIAESGVHPLSVTPPTLNSREGDVATMVSGDLHETATGQLLKHGGRAENALLLGADGQHGNSGSPWVIEGEDGYKTIGITVHGPHKGSWQCGVVYTPELFQDMLNAFGSRQSNFTVSGQNPSAVQAVQNFLHGTLNQGK